MQYLHKKNIGYFIELQNIYVERKMQVKVRNFTKAYIVKKWF